MKILELLSEFGMVTRTQGHIQESTICLPTNNELLEIEILKDTCNSTQNMK